MDRIAHRLAILSALVGGIVLSALIVLTCLSITGRAFVFAGLGPVPGDFELVEAGIAFAVFSFLPICQVQAGHATVDLFTNALGRGANRWLVAFWESLFAGVMVLIAWRLAGWHAGQVRQRGNLDVPAVQHLVGLCGLSGARHRRRIGRAVVRL
jgi:TRAP-type C4-dicarboxylate transport system permease small subunit